MLKHLFIKNIALIDKIEIDFEKGLNILTGETGAGKSIIIDSINSVLGSRISKDMIRTGQEKAQVEAIFEIHNSKIVEYLKLNELLDEEEQLILSREFNVNGKNICRVNGSMVTNSILRDIGQLIIDIHGQHDNQSLLNSSTHIDLLDSFRGEKILDVKKEYETIFEEYKEIKSKIESLGGDERERERKIDLLRFQLEEIDGSKLKIGEDKELEEQKTLMSNSERIITSIENTYDALYTGNKQRSIIDALNIAVRELTSVEKYDKKIEDFAKIVQNLYYSCEDVIEEIRDYKDSFEFEPSILEEIDEKLDTIYRLKRKYGSTIEEILNYRDTIKEELDELEKSKEKIEEYTKKLSSKKEQLRQKALELSNLRKSIAGEIEGRIVKELEELEMKKTKFKVRFEEYEENEGSEGFTQKGIDKVEFLISPNVGENLKPLSKIASGGEMSRIMLAIKTILADVDEIPTLIFDEIDIGISGRVAQMVGQKLAYIAKTHQVLCITHLPQIASMADNHYLIEKYTDGNTTKTQIKKLDANEKKQEIARIIGGIKITETTLMHAQEMLELAQQRKNA